jgi:O-acetylhomoserine/O-acetylserine sulfhydrylase-like pyridoxal-dependent enzyme
VSEHPRPETIALHGYGALVTTQETVRLSVGIEHIDDIVEDLDQALVSAGALVTV